MPRAVFLYSFISAPATAAASFILFIGGVRVPVVFAPSFATGVGAGRLLTSVEVSQEIRVLERSDQGDRSGQGTDDATTSSSGTQKNHRKADI